MNPTNKGVARNKNVSTALQSTTNGKKLSGGAFAHRLTAEAPRGLYTPPPAYGKPVGEYLDHAVGEILDGPLSRGTVRAERREQFDYLIRKNLYREHRDVFMAGMLDSMQTLYRRHANGSNHLHSILDISGTKRTNAADREAWQQSLQHIPDEVVTHNGRVNLEDATDTQIAEFERGRFAAPLCLSGLAGAYDVDPPKGGVVEPFVPVILPESVQAGPEVMSVQTTADPKVFELYNDGSLVTRFTVQDSEDPIAAGTNAYLNLDDPGESKMVFTETFDDAQYEIDLNDPEAGRYQVYNQDGDLAASFTHSGDAEDHETLWEAAKTALQGEGVIECCSECQDSLADNEGYDGLCGNCADEAESSGE